MRAEADALLTALGEAGCQGAQDRLPGLLAAVRAPLAEAPTREVLEALRAQRCFALMQTFASEAAKVAAGNLLVYVNRQLAQARIELGLLDPAIELLEQLRQIVDGGGDDRERSEVSGLLGRAYKQRFVSAVAAGTDGAPSLRQAIAAYERVFSLDPSWHGANIVALAARSERDGFASGTAPARDWAERLLGELRRKSKPQWFAWDYAAAGEAYLALGEGERDNVARHFNQYWNLASTDGFALAGTKRQLKEIWQISRSSGDEFESSLLVHLEARMVGAPRGASHYSAADLVRLAGQLAAESAQAEATYGAGSAIPLRRMLDLIGKAKSVCRITDPYDAVKAGTGFLIDGADLDGSLAGVFVLTNHHVLHGREASPELLAHEDYRGSVDVARAEAEFTYWGGKVESRTIKLKEVVRSSERCKADYALASLAEDVPRELALTPSRIDKPLGSRNVVDLKQRAKVFLIGHPKGGAASFSVSDNEVIDHELDDNPCAGPRRIHYRAPTEPGSSGSPVFHGETLELVGLHRSGRVGPMRKDWPYAKAGEVYEANEAVSFRTLREMLVAQR